MKERGNRQKIDRKRREERRDGDDFFAPKKRLFLILKTPPNLLGLLGERSSHDGLDESFVLDEAFIISAASAELEDLLSLGVGELLA